MAAGPEGLTGVWDGQYSYPRGPGPVPFTAVILETGAMICGTTHEQPSAGRSAGRTLTAMIEGRRDGSAVSFTKLYDPGQQVHGRPILYEGVLSADGREIEGRWTLPASWSGRFLMIRSGPPAASAEAQERTVVPALPD